MKKMKRILLILLSLLVILLPLLSLFSVAFLVAPQFSNTFVGELNEKYDRLYETKEPKLVVIGGSSVAFGLDSALLEQYLDMPVVNFGLYASLGTKVMLDLSRDAIGKGDIVVIAPEMDAQTLSLYFSSETTLNAMDDEPAMALRIAKASPDNFFSMIGGLWKYAGTKLEYLRDGAPDPDGVYNGKNFNEYGDLVYDRPENVMSLAYDPNTIIDLSESIVDPAFVDYLNDYIHKMEKRGAKVYFSYCPMNSLALKEGTTEEDAEAFGKYLSSVIDCPFISEIGDYILEPGYFYDTNFHLNDAGVTVRSVNLLRDILLEEGTPTLVNVEIPDAPALKDADVRFLGNDENEIYFTYEKEKNGAYTITGLTPLGAAQKTLTVPLGTQSYKITAIGQGALRDSAVETLIVPENTNLTRFANGAFEGAGHLSRLEIYATDATAINPSVTFAGVAEDFELHVSPASNFKTDYYWSERGIKIIEDLE